MKKMLIVIALTIGLGIIGYALMGSDQANGNTPTPTPSSSPAVAKIEAANLDYFSLLINLNLPASLEVIWIDEFELAIATVAGIAFVDWEPFINAAEIDNLAITSWEAEQPIATIDYIDTLDLLVVGDQAGGITFFQPSASTEQAIYLTASELPITHITHCANHLIVSTAEEVQVWTWEEGSQLEGLSQAMIVPLEWVNDLAVMQDDCMLLMASLRGISVKNITDVPSEFRANSDWGDGIASIALAHDAGYLAYGSPRGVIRIWGDTHFTTPEFLLRGHADAINDLLFTSNATLLFSASSDATIRIWDMTTGDALKTLDIFEGQVIHLALNSSDTFLAVVADDGSVQIWGIQE